MNIKKLETSTLRDFGPSGMKFTSIGLGTWNMEKDERGSIAAIHQGIQDGANHIDTAEMYGDGRVEEIVGKAVKGVRRRVRIVSKVLPSHARYAEVLDACESSLRRLQTDYLDTYLLHWKKADTPIEETFAAFEKLKEQGKILSWGVSNFSAGDMKEAVRIAGEGKIACNQVLYHLEERAIEFDLAPWCVSHEIAIVGYSPFFSGKPARHKTLEKIAQDRGVTPEQVTLAFLTRYFLTFSIPKSSNPERARQNVQAMRLRLSEAEIEEIEAAFPAQAKDRLPTL